MKKRLFLFLPVMFIGLAIVLTGVHTAEAGPIKLTYSNFFHPFTSRASWPRPGAKRLKSVPTEE